MSTLVAAPCYLHAVIQVKPHKQEDFLRLMGDLKATMHREFGVELAGFLRGHEKPGMYVNIWAIPSDEVLARIMKEAHNHQVTHDIEACMESETVELVRPAL